MASDAMILGSSMLVGCCCVAAAAQQPQAAAPAPVARTSKAAESLLDADRALAAESHRRRPQSNVFADDIHADLRSQRRGSRGRAADQGRRRCTTWPGPAPALPHSRNNIGRSAERADCRFRLPAHVDLQQLFTLRTKLDYCRTARVDRPDVAFGVEPDRVRNLVQSLPKRAQDAAVLVNRYDPIGFVAALNEPRNTGLRVARQPRNHALILFLG